MEQQSIQSTTIDDPWESRVHIVRRHFEAKGYRVHSGLQFGSELVLYADDPSKVHSDFCVHVVREDGYLDWRQMQSLVRSMPDLHKTLILAQVVQQEASSSSSTTNNGKKQYVVEELALATEHAPFRHKKKEPIMVAGQQKKQIVSLTTTTTTTTTTKADNIECADENGVI